MDKFLTFLYPQALEHRSNYQYNLTIILKRASNIMKENMRDYGKIRLVEIAGRYKEQHTAGHASAE